MRVRKASDSNLEAIAHPPERPDLRIADSVGDTGIVVCLNEVRHLTDALARAAPDLAGTMVGDPPLVLSFLGAEQVG